jgi:hypothetical protein
MSDPAGSQTPHAALAVSLLPATDTLAQGGSLPLMATISGWTTDSTISWIIIGIGVAPGTTQSQLGSINCTGLTATYSAPSTLATSQLLVRVRVRSNQDTLNYADCILTIQSKGNGKLSILVNPTAVTLQPSQTQQFQATVSGSTNMGVRWKLVSGPGSLTSAGWYIAPSTLSDTSATAIIEAIALADSTVRGQAAITIQTPGPCFRTVVQPILISHCTIQGCHNPTDHVRGYDFTTYAGLMAVVIPGDTANSLLFQRINHVVILSPTQIAAIGQWIYSGAPNSQCPDDFVDCDTTGIHYSTYVQPTIAIYCLGCHSQRTAGICDSLDFTNYATVQEVAQSGTLLNVLRHRFPLPAMPQYGPELDSCTIGKIAAWVNRGAPND